jgi:2-keto-4-pentenoate hydratase/2-oxohepta-3-ene-1,7-dioic acid hydratase in catechol pathway
MAVLMPGPARAQQAPVSDRPSTPFKLATFEAGGRVRLGMAMQDRLLDIAEANAHVMKQAGLSPVAIPGDMRALIEQYDVLSGRLYQIANYMAGNNRLAASGLGFVFDPSKVSFKAPIKYPYNLLCLAANYKAHRAEMSRPDSARAAGPPGGGGFANVDVDPEKDFPYLFAKSPRSCIVDPETPYYIPAGRDKIDWEGELVIVMGKPAFNVSVASAAEHIFGFTIGYDVSDRGGQKRTKPSFPVDWFSGKSRDGAAPMGPYIVPKEFLPNYAGLRLVTKVNDRIVQDGNTSDLIYDVEHIIAHTSAILTLYPGDCLLTGTPDGVGAGRTPPEFLKPGDTVSIEIEGIGTLRTPIRATPGSSQ